MARNKRKASASGSEGEQSKKKASKGNGSDAPKKPKMRWNAEKDRELMILAMNREVANEEYQGIADTFPGRPTPKEIQERLTELRKEQIRKLQALGLDQDTLETVNAVRPEDVTAEEREEERKREEASKVPKTKPALLGDQSSPLAIIRQNPPGTCLADLVKTGQIPLKKAVEIAKELDELDAAAATRNQQEEDARRWEDENNLYDD